MIAVPVLLIGGPMDGARISVRGDQPEVRFQSMPVYERGGCLTPPVQHEYRIHHLRGEDDITYRVGVAGTGCVIRLLIEGYPEKEA